MRCRCSCLIAVMVVSMLLSLRAGAIVLVDKEFRNKSAPTGSLANSGWQWQGLWGAFTGTPIARNYFVTASHVGGSVGQSLTLNGKSYQTIAMFDDPGSDLRIWKTSRSFSSFAPIYTGSSEIGKTAVLFGRGSQRGANVTIHGVTHGWFWGPQDQRLSWGENKIKSIVDGGSGIGKALAFTFDRKGDHVSNEGTTSAGDSSGAMFVNASGKWQLAGINYSVDGPYSITGGAQNFMASLFDQGGTILNGQLINDGTNDIGAHAYATRISSNQSWIKSVLAGRTAISASLARSSVVPEPATATAGLIAAAAMILRRKRRGQV
jgi:hypothetical protein